MSYRYEEVKPASSLKRNLVKCGMVVCGLFAIFFFLRGLPPSWLPNGIASAVNASTAPPLEEQLLTRPIRDVKLGQRALGRNPIREEVEKNLPEIVSEKWREIHLELNKDNGDLLTVQLLRQIEWVEIENATVGNSIYLDLPEMGAVGDAKVTYVGSCPEIEQGDGNIVTGKFIHNSAGNLINLTLEGQAKPTGVTDNHPYWSVDRKAFIEAGDLKLGETLNTPTGTTHVVSITPRPDEPVYNLEIYGEHVYRVDELGVLVHNSCSQKLGKDLVKNGYGKPGKAYQAAHLVPTGAFSNRAKKVTAAIRRAQKKFNKHIGSSSRNKAINGFWAKAGHAGTHTDKYFLEMGELFKKVNSKGSAKQVMDILWERVKRGDYID